MAGETIDAAAGGPPAGGGEGTLSVRNGDFNNPAAVQSLPEGQQAAFTPDGNNVSNTNPDVQVQQKQVPTKTPIVQPYQNKAEEEYEGNKPDVDPNVIDPNAQPAEGQTKALPKVGGDDNTQPEPSWLDKYNEVPTDYRPIEEDKFMSDYLSSYGGDIADFKQAVFENDGQIPQEYIDKIKQSAPARDVDILVEAFHSQAELTMYRQRYAHEQVHTMVTDVYSVFDGEDGYNAFNKWASTGGMNKEEIDALNKILGEDGDHTIRLAAMEAYKARMTADPAIPNIPLMKGGTSNPGSIPYTGGTMGKEEFIEIMATDKYKNDREYAAHIDSRRAATMANEGITGPEFPKWMKNR